MPFGEHLDELRRRLILALVAPVPLFVLFFWFGEPIRNWMCMPLVRALQSNRLPVQLQTLSPVETVLTDLKLGLVLSLVVSAPWILWQAWCFIAPGLYRHERRFVQFLFPASAFLVASGVAMLYFLALPLLLTMLVSFGVSKGPMDIPPVVPLAPTPAPPSPDDPASMDQASPRVAPDEAPGPRIPALAEHPGSPIPGAIYLKVPENLLCLPMDVDGKVETLSVPLGRSTMLVQQYRLSEYIDFVLLMTAAVAVASQMPLVILLLGWLDVLRLETLRSHRKHALFICAVLAAILTPTADMITMVAALIPLYLLYELGVLLLWLLPPSRIAGARQDEPLPEVVPATGTVPRGSEHEGS